MFGILLGKLALKSRPDAAGDTARTYLDTGAVAAVLIWAPFTKHTAFFHPNEITESREQADTVKRIRKTVEGRGSDREHHLHPVLSTALALSIYTIHELLLKDLERPNAGFITVSQLPKVNVATSISAFKD